jgi:hypothetical protein
MLTMPDNMTRYHQHRTDGAITLQWGLWLDWDTTGVKVVRQFEFLPRNRRPRTLGCRSDINGIGKDRTDNLTVRPTDNPRNVPHRRPA